MTTMIDVAAQRAAEEMEAADRAEMRSILEAEAPHLMEVWEAGRARQCDLDFVLERMLRRRVAALLGQPFPAGGLIQGMPYRGSLTAFQFARLRAVERAVVASGMRVFTCESRESRGGRGAGPRCVAVTARLGGHQVSVISRLVPVRPDLAPPSAVGERR